MSRTKTRTFHFRFYRYVRMMLRRYPSMRKESLGARSNSGVLAIRSQK